MTSSQGFSTGLALGKLKGVTSHLLLVGVLRKGSCRGSSVEEKHLHFLFKIMKQEGEGNTMSKYGVQPLRECSSCSSSLFYILEEVVAKKSYSQPLPVLQIKAITLIGLIRSPLQPREYRLFQLGPLPLIKGYQQNPPQTGDHKTLFYSKKVLAVKRSISPRKVSQIIPIPFKLLLVFYDSSMLILFRMDDFVMVISQPWDYPKPYKTTIKPTP